ncbi:hypothetical protein F7Q99_38565 [Streptomyces kaniharaensis]|uniref:Uncharacterized protein n=1 Tax=Streptomyces kaniharaensis TaxID=212423 RepID=A0A6N7L2D5_9ACTN|nr:hypothetical protein [Streptomyces kaniharaensis]MQS17940.1 hypothetical protein [Streptomyces kaniharaensis]
MTPHHWQPTTVTPLVPAQPPQIMSAGTYLVTRYGGRVAPFLSTTTALVLARIWHDQGAAGSWGDVALMLALSAGSTFHGVVSASKEHGHEVITAVAFAASGSFALIGVAAYTSSWALAAILWLVATVLVYSVTARHWRTARERAEARWHELQLTQVNRLADVETARLQATVQAQALTYGLMLAQAIDHRQTLDPATFQAAMLAGTGLPQLTPASTTTTKEINS